MEGAPAVPHSHTTWGSGDYSTRVAARRDLRHAGRQTIRDIARAYDDLITRTYARIRFTILRQPFLEEIGQYLTPTGRVLDLGCGFGLFSMYYAALAPQRQMIGVDLNPNRIERATRTAKSLGIDNVAYEAADALDWVGQRTFDGIYFLDLIHHLPSDRVPGFLAKVRELLAPGATLVIKEVADRPYLKMPFTLILDRLMVGMDPIHYWSSDNLCGLLEELGFEVVAHRMIDVLPYSHVLYVARLVSQRPAQEEPPFTAGIPADAGNSNP
jgi:2-polyprenyl-3-methyl-5-hydroxy-6-metoxy-1,4-benzoquinol methylase